ncbi:terminase large subunit protein [Rhizobium phage RHph_TM39]|uniref:Terminase large subunit protein n=1 Tax=Rhizobium phage RHph_TM30 TaxID=2509764 RepID=A0A7S5RB92_9CAUD|nr:terminase large subunit protein [Rhizobium phage RHph_TM30]QIG71470.1 terminase large subunit protein [Rhizobium phage RHph_TM30]QIG72195.1 terminase large subunit protein [Rhizobium phage RHph_TM2_3B]QIG77326.1 terminase large subunit protein [Rhizobium phage RHph_TM39]
MSTENNTSPVDQSMGALVQNLMAAHGKTETLRTLAKMGGYVDAPPTIDKFIDDDYFMGDMFGDNTYPIWRSALYEIYPNPFFSPYLEIVLTGSIGQGKSTCALAGVTYDLCKLLYLKDPHEKYNLIKSTKIVLALMNATKSLAGTVLYDQIITYLKNSPFFKSEMKKTSGKLSILPNNIDIITGSRPSDVLGKAVFSTILSEINFQNKVAGQAVENYNGVLARLQSRFMKNESYPGRMWIDSSKTDSGSFIEDYLLKGREDDPKIRIWDNPIWKVLPPWKIQYSGQTFKVFVGNQFKDPFIITPQTGTIGIDESYIMDVPIEYQVNFEKDIYRALQDIAGKSTQAAHRFIPSVEKIEESFKKDNPVHKDVVSVDFFNPNERLIEFIDFTKLDKDRRPRFIHVDLGIKHDKTGIASTRLDGIITTRRFDAIAGKEIVESSPVYSTDFVMYIEARIGQEVPIYKIKNLMIDLRARGYPVTCITTDGYQSTNLRQDLLLEGFNTELLSCDRTFDPYNEFKLAILESRWHGIKHPILSKELKELEVGTRKVDHPMEGSKDGADAICGSIWSAKLGMNRYRANTTTEEFIEAIASSSKPTNSYEGILGTSDFQVYK